MCEHTLPLSSFALLCVVVVPPAVDVLVHGRRVLFLLCRWWDVTCSPLVPCTVYLARLPEQYERAAGGQFGATLTRRLRFSLSSPISPCFYLRDQKLSSGILLLTFMTTHLFYVSFADTEHYWLFRTGDLKLPPGLRLLTFMATHLCHVRFASVCRHGKDPTTSTGTVISLFVCTRQALDSTRTSSMLLGALQHIFAGLKRTRDQKLSSGLSYLSFQVEDKRACWLRSGFQGDSYLQ